MRARWLVVFIALVYLILGIFTINDYGVTWDEPENFYMGRVYLNVFTFVSTRFLRNPHDLVVGQALPFREETHFERYLPVAPALASLFSYVLAERFHFFHPIDAHHLAIVVFGLIGGIALCGITWELTGSLVLALLSSVVLFLDPVWFGHAHNNIKDIPGASLFVLSLYTWVVAAKRPKMHAIIVASVVTGIALSTKITTVMVIPIVVVWTIVVFRKRLFRAAHTKKLFVYGAVGALAAAATVAVIWPWIMTNPFAHFRELYQYGTEVGKGLGTIFAGRSYSAGISVPWYYAPGYLIYTTPIPILVFAAIGAIASVVSFFGRHAKNRYTLLPFVWIVLVLGRYISPHVIIYNGVRHVMEVIPAVVLLSVFGIQSVAAFLGRFIHHVRTSIVLYILGAAIVLSEALIIVRLHPYEALYFNALSGGMKTASDLFEFDYWGLSAKELVDEANRVSPDYKKTVNVIWIDFKGDYFPHNRLQLLDSSHVTDFVIVPHSNNYFSGALGYQFAHGRLIKTVVRDGATIGYLFATHQ